VKCGMVKQPKVKKQANWRNKRSVCAIYATGIYIEIR
jgi:hypothetical protein